MLEVFRGFYVSRCCHTRPRIPQSINDSTDEEIPSLFLKTLHKDLRFASWMLVAPIAAHSVAPAGCISQLGGAVLEILMRVTWSRRVRD
jgi:hypothetical protein